MNDKKSERALAGLVFFSGLKFASVEEWVWAMMLLLCVATYIATEALAFYVDRKRQARDQ